jgi:glycosyltransferase involved in cell wall biosynthesis
MTVSVALIVKNEEHTLARCLDSFAGVVDEVVVVDTGSTDATKEVARRYTGRVFDFEWRDDFAAARQFAFDRASCEWVMWVDADDVVRGAERIGPLAASAPPGVHGFCWRYDCDRDAWGNTLCEFWRERCVRNDGSFQWEGRIHEVLVGLPGCNVVRNEEVVVEHRRDPARATRNLRRNLRILEDEYETARRDGRAPVPRLLFYLGNEYASAGKERKALRVYGEYLRASTWDDERYQAQTRVAALHRRLRRFDRAVDADLRALKICPHWPAAYFGLAESYYYLRDWHKVIHWCEVGRAMPAPDTPLFVNPMGYGFDWIIFYTNALFHVGEVREALAWTRRALELRPDDAWHRQNFLLFAEALGAHTPPSPQAAEIVGRAATRSGDRTAAPEAA